jgi:hypothetical protein
MSLAYYISLDLDDEEIDTFVDGKAVAHQLERLNALADQLGLVPLDSWVSMNQDDLDDLLGDEDENEDELADLQRSAADDTLPQESWFSAEEGVAYFEALAEHLRIHPDAVPDADAVLADLEDYIRVLAQAQSLQAQWHLAIDF